jgi:lipid II isoglutaminyl synthase (glutamine-hydrolysing)
VSTDDRLTPRVRFARACAHLAGTAARLAGGRASVLPGNVALRVAPKLLDEVLRGRRACFVSGTNGKTTTTALIAAAIGPAAISNADGANLPTGWATVLLDAPPDAPAVLEVDEAYLPAALSYAPDAVVVLLNLSRDQLDRHAETRMLAQRWRDVFAKTAHAKVVANVDDPLVVFAASAARDVIWVEGGAHWKVDATTCPACGRLLTRGDAGWSCACGLRRPEPEVHQPAPSVARALPGRANRGNIAMAVGAAAALGVDPDRALEAMAAVTSVSGRYMRHRVDGHEVMVLLAKNPAGWVETLDIIDEVLGDGPGTVVVAINARGPDGRDPSWLWDVPFEQLAGRDVIATGERGTDLAVRLDSAGVAYRKDLRAPLVVAGDAHEEPVVIAATYTNFLAISRALADRA